MDIHAKLASFMHLAGLDIHGEVMFYEQQECPGSLRKAEPAATHLISFLHPVMFEQIMAQKDVNAQDNAAS